MADLIIVYWRDIPAQVIVKKGRQNAKRELPLRFLVPKIMQQGDSAIEGCAHRRGTRDGKGHGPQFFLIGRVGYRRQGQYRSGYRQQRMHSHPEDYRANASRGLKLRDAKASGRLRLRNG